ncbi:MAG: hypothetical protein ACYDCH_13935, partial [Gaiellaceae bacterium]
MRALLARTLVVFAALVASLAAPALAGAATTLSVNAAAGPPSYNPTGVTIPAGAHVTVTATGSWNVACSNPARQSGPNGLAGVNGGYIDPAAPAGTLVGSLDGGATWFSIGAGPTVVNGPGTLVLAANDYSTNFGDNCGTLSVTIADPVSTLISGNGSLGGADSQVQASLDGTNWAPAYVVTPNVYATAISGTQFVAQGGIEPGGHGGLPITGSDASPALDYYRIAFTLPASFSAPSISGLMKADNAAVAYLNGTQIGTQPIQDTGNNWADPGTSFSSSNASLFHAGVNYLSFDLYNMGGPQGLDFDATVTFSPVPPDTTPPALSLPSAITAEATG